MHLLIAGMTFVAHLAATAPISPDSALIIPKSIRMVPGSSSLDTAKAPDVAAKDTAPVRALTSSSEATLALVMASTFGMNARLQPGMPSGRFAFAVAPDTGAGDTTRTSRRPRAIEYSDAYHTRLKIHQIGAYLMIPLFIGEYVLGEKLLTSTNRSNGLKTAHSVVAAGVGVVFVANTVTGAWNFWDARKDPNGRTRRDIHSALMLASDVGFLLTAASAGDAQRSLSQARKHRTIAISSIAISAVGAGMMWLWKN